MKRRSIRVHPHRFIHQQGFSQLNVVHQQVARLEHPAGFHALVNAMLERIRQQFMVRDLNREERDLRWASGHLAQRVGPGTGMLVSSW